MNVAPSIPSTSLTRPLELGPGVTVVDGVPVVDLETLLRRAHACGLGLSPATAVAIATDILEILARAHARGERHGHIGFDTIVVGFDGRARLVASRALRAEIHRSRAWGAPVDHRTDLYAVGAVLYRLLTDRLVVDDLVDHPRVPTIFEPVVARALARDLDRRFARAEDFAEALMEVAEELTVVNGGVRRLVVELFETDSHTVDCEAETLEFFDFLPPKRIVAWPSPPSAPPVERPAPEVVAREATPAWLNVLFGVVIGLVIAVGVVSVRLHFGG